MSADYDTEFGDYEAHEVAAMAPGMTCGACGDEIIWHRTRARWEHIGEYDHDADGPEPVFGRPDHQHLTGGIEEDPQVLAEHLRRDHGLIERVPSDPAAWHRQAHQRGR